MKNSNKREDAERFDDVILPENYEWENLVGGENENEDGAPAPPPLPSTVTIKNRTAFHRCLQCNVNLCMDCMNDWHGYGFDRINQL